MIKQITYKIKLIKFELEGGGKHIAINSRINSKKAILIIDTGASNSIFDKDNDIFKESEFFVVANNGSGSGFNSEISNLYTGFIKSINISRLRIKDFPAVFTSMSHINELYKSLGLPVVTGIIGSDFLFAHNAIIDFKSKVLIIDKIGR